MADLNNPKTEKDEPTSAPQDSTFGVVGDIVGRAFAALMSSFEAKKNQLTPREIESTPSVSADPAAIDPEQEQKVVAEEKERIHKQNQLEDENNAYIDALEDEVALGDMEMEMSSQAQLDELAQEQELEIAPVGIEQEDDFDLAPSTHAPSGTDEDLFGFKHLVETDDEKISPVNDNPQPDNKTDLMANPDSEPSISPEEKSQSSYQSPRLNK